MRTHLTLLAALGLLAEPAFAGVPAPRRLEQLDGKPWVIIATVRGPSREVVEPALRRTLEQRLSALGARPQVRTGRDAGVEGPGGQDLSSVVATCTIEPRARGMACGFRAVTRPRGTGDDAVGRVVLEHAPMMPRWQRDDAGLSAAALVQDAELQANNFAHAIIEWLSEPAVPPGE